MVVEKIKTRNVCSTIAGFSKLCLYELMWKDMVEADRPQMTIQCSAERNAVGMLENYSKKTDIHS